MFIYLISKSKNFDGTAPSIFDSWIIDTQYSAPGDIPPQGFQMNRSKFEYLLPV